LNTSQVKFKDIVLD